jgi:hypothetical protein
MRVVHSPKRVEEGVAPKTVAMMQPTAVRSAVLGEVSHHGAKPGRMTFSNQNVTRSKESWSQEIWVMIQDLGKQRKIISAWRYPGMTRPRSEVSMDALRREYREFLAGKK